LARAISDRAGNLVLQGAQVVDDPGFECALLESAQFGLERDWQNSGESLTRTFLFYFSVCKPLISLGASKSAG
jgi:hypothetical protein